MTSAWTVMARAASVHGHVLSTQGALQPCIERWTPGGRLCVGSGCGGCAAGSGEPFASLFGAWPRPRRTPPERFASAEVGASRRGMAAVPSPRRAKASRLLGRGEVARKTMRAWTCRFKA